MLLDFVNNPNDWITAYRSSTSKAILQLRVYRTSSTYITLGPSDLMDCRLKAGYIDNGFALGQFLAAELDFTMVNSRVAQSIPAMARVELYIGYVGVGSIKYGEYFIDTRDNNGYSTQFVCFDRTLMFENPFPKTYTFPMTFSAFVQACCTKTYTTLNSSGGISGTISEYPEGKTMREVLGYIAACGGGNFAITPRGLTFLTIRGSTGNELDCTHAHRISTSCNYPAISYVKFNADTETSYLAGTDPEQNDVYGIEIDNPYANQTITNSVYGQLVYYGYSPCVIEDARLLPLCELGDTITIDTGRTEIVGHYDEDTDEWIEEEEPVYKSVVLLHMDMQLYPTFRGDIGSPGSGELTHEYTYDGADSLAHSKENDSTTGNGYYNGYGTGISYDPTAVRLNRVYNGFWIDNTAGAHLGHYTQLGVTSDGNNDAAIILRQNPTDREMPIMPERQTSIRNIIVVTRTDFLNSNYTADIGDVIAVVPDPTPSV